MPSGSIIACSSSSLLISYRVPPNNRSSLQDAGRPIDENWRDDSLGAGRHVCRYCLPAAGASARLGHGELKASKRNTSYSNVPGSNNMEQCPFIHFYIAPSTTAAVVVNAATAVPVALSCYVVLHRCSVGCVDEEFMPVNTFHSLHRMCHVAPPYASKIYDVRSHSTYCMYNNSATCGATYKHLPCTAHWYTCATAALIMYHADIPRQ